MFTSPGRAAAIAVRQQRLRDLAAQDGIDAVLCYSSGIHTFVGTDPVRYLSGFKAMTGGAVAILPRDGELVLLVAPRWEFERAHSLAPGSCVVVVDDAAAGATHALASAGLRQARIAVVGFDRMPRRARDALHAAVDSPITGFDDEFDALAQIKDAYEIELLRRGAAIAETAYQRLLQCVDVGVSEYALAAEVIACSKAGGADDNFLLMASSQCNVGVRPVSDRRLDIGDVIISEITPSVDGQFVQLNRTTVLGGAQPDQIAAYEVLRRSLAAAIEVVHPDATIADVVHAADDVLTAAGYGQYLTGNRRGHGLGLGSITPGDLTPANRTVLRAGMAFVLHPNQYLPELGYVMCGEPLVVTDGGAEVLTQRPALLDYVEPGQAA